MLEHNSRPLNEVALFAPLGANLGQEARGLTSIGSSAETTDCDGYRLNWLFTRWLMGFPVGWLDSEHWAMRSSRLLRHASSDACSTQPIQESDEDGDEEEI
jgi:hypothetical protein